ncbi:hypothetical protein Cgig2_021329 [Carnegiea gigantea]|uniref:Uncharacterized protein n=1 Tax=Carnegiea gigantea TaxID=171969 RepID=A0A9Q1Q4Z5_9CARY|nr:hypothetical protein Cgig2_021329 [Carnegiea gigantea]
MGRGGNDHPCHQIDKGQISYAQTTKFSVGRAAYTLDSIPKSRAHSALLPPISIPANVIGFRSMPTSSAGKPSPLKAPLLPKVTIIEPVRTPQLLGSPPLHDILDKDNSSTLMSLANLEDNIFLARPTQGINHKVPINEDPLNAMEEDMPQNPNENIYEDSQDLPVMRRIWWIPFSIWTLYKIWKCPLNLLRNERQRREMKGSPGLLLN